MNSCQLFLPLEDFQWDTCLQVVNGLYHSDNCLDNQYHKARSGENNSRTHLYTHLIFCYHVELTNLIIIKPR